MKSNARLLALTAVFVALVVLLGMTPLGIIPLVVINVTILHIPVIVGTLVLGLRRGLFLGACFGAVSTLRAFGIPLPASALVSALMAESPVLVILMCLVPRLLIPVATHAARRLAEGKVPGRVSALPIAAVAGSLTNTIFYLGMMLVFFTISGLDSAPVLGVIAGTGVIAGGSEALAAAVISTPVVLALRKLDKKNRG
jgi:uncharacterized membrane protein